MSIEEGMDQLSKGFKGRDWFYDIGADQYGRIVVYVKYMCHETLHGIPDKAGGIQVLVHFAASKTATREQFTDNGSNVKPSFQLTPSQFYDKAKEAQRNGADVGFGQMVNDLPGIDQEIDKLMADEEEKSILHLQKELDRLEKICGSHTVQDIFYEVHDNNLTNGRDTVTNMSGRYPEVRKVLEKLYDQYGFDVIYEELDG